MPDRGHRGRSFYSIMVLEDGIEGVGVDSLIVGFAFFLLPRKRGGVWGQVPWAPPFFEPRRGMSRRWVSNLE